MTDFEIYLSDVKDNVTMIKQGKSYLFKNMPVLKTGRWNGRKFTESDLQAMADNFSEIKNSWEPPMRPYHGYDHQGNPITEIDARNTIGWHKNLQYNKDNKTLYADIEVQNENDANLIENGTLRYVSAEVARKGWQNSATDKTYDTPVYVGGAFVADPAVKGMNWGVVVNSMDYCTEIESYMDTTEAEGMIESELPPESYLIVGDRNVVSSWHLAYRDADTSSEKTNEWGNKERYTKAGPINCRRVRAIAGVLMGGMGSKITASDLDAEAKKKLKAAAIACNINSPVIEGLDNDTDWFKRFLDMLSSEELTDKEVAQAIAKSEVKDMEENIEQETEEIVAEEVEVQEDIQEEVVEVIEEVIEEVVEDKPETMSSDIKSQIEQLQKTIEDQAEAIKAKDLAIEIHAAEVRKAKASDVVDRWISSGKIPPVSRVKAFALYEVLSKLEGKVEILSESGEEVTSEVVVADLLDEVISGKEAEVKLEPEVRLFEGNYIAPDSISKEEADAKATEMISKLK